MIEPLLHPRTRLQVDAFLHQSAHSLLITGTDGIGKYYLAQSIAAQLSDESITLVPPADKTTITIEQIRELYAITKTGGSLTIIIRDAQIMGTEAQNAFLKLLEEPPKNTTFILTAVSSASVLQTIRSRCQHIDVVQPLKADILSLAQQQNTGLSDLQLQSLLSSSRGLPGTFFQLLKDDQAATYHTAILTEAKTFYSSTAYQRYILCAKHTYQKQWALDVMNILSIIVEALLKTSTSKQTLLQQADILQETTFAISESSANVKIQLTHLVEQL